MPRKTPYNPLEVAFEFLRSICGKQGLNTEEVTQRMNLKDISYDKNIKKRDKRLASQLNGYAYRTKKSRRAKYCWFLSAERRGQSASEILRSFKETNGLPT